MSVKVLDFQRMSAEQAKEEILRWFGPGAPLNDYRRVLVLDSPELLVPHTAAYEAVFAGNRIQGLVCVACERLVAGRSERPVLSVPGQLGPERGAITLWVSDDTGVEWGMRPPARARPHPGVVPGARTGIERLIEVLKQPEIFDRVVELGRDLPSAAAAPGLVLSGTGNGAGTVNAAVSHALARFTTATATDPEPSGASAPSGEILVDLMEGTHRSAPGSTDPGRGELARHENRARDEILRAAEAFDELSRAGGLLSAPPAQLREVDLPAAGDALEAYRDHADRLIRRYNSLTDEQLARELARSPVAGRTPTPEDQDKALEWMATQVRAELDRGTPLPGIARRLDTIVRRVSPRGWGSDIGVTEAAPDGVIDTLRHPPPAPYPPVLSWLLLPAFLLPALPALTGGWLGLVGAITLAVAWVLAVVTGAHRLAGPHTADLGLPAAHAVAGFAGGFVGMWAGTMFLTELLPPPLLLTAALLLGAGLGCVLLFRAWYSLVRRWKTQCGLQQAERAVGALTQLVNRFAEEEWYPRAQRRRLADSARAAASTGRALSRALTDRVNNPEPAPSHAPELEAILGAHLVGLADNVLSGLSADLRSGMPPKAAAEGAGERARDLTARYFTKLGEEGAHAPPPFPLRRVPEMAYSGPEVEEVTRTLRLPVEGPMLQLSDPATFSSFRDSPKAVQAVRFAPGFLRRRIGPGGNASSVVWTTGGSRTGILRLIPLRPGAVRSGWYDPDQQVDGGRESDRFDGGPEREHAAGGVRHGDDPPVEPQDPGASDSTDTSAGTDTRGGPGTEDSPGTADAPEGADEQNEVYSYGLSMQGPRIDAAPAEETGDAPEPETGGEDTADSPQREDYLR